MQENPQKSLNLLYNVSRELSASMDLHTILERVLSLCTRDVAAERGSIVAMDENMKPVDGVLIINQVPIENTVYDIQGILDHGLAGWVVRNHLAALVTDTSQDQRWYRRPDDSTNQTGAKSAICIPFLLAGDQLVGVLTIVHPLPGFFSESHLLLLQSISDQAAITISNALLFQSLQLAQKRYEELFEGSIDPILVTTWKGEILEANRKTCEVFSMDKEGLLSKSIFDLHQADWEWLGEKSDELHNDQTITYVSEINQNEQVTPVEVHIHKVDINGAEYLQWIMHDISERIKLDQMRDELSAMVYHDLRSPLSNVESSLDMLTSLIPQEYADTAGQLVQIATRSTKRVQNLINSLLDINRLETGHPIAKREWTKFEKVIQDAIDAIQVNLDTKDLQMDVKIPEGSPSLFIDKDMVKRVFINLLDNAIKFAPQKGHIWLTVTNIPDFLHFSIQDDGPGISPEFRERVFEKYAYLNIDKPKKGIGLGLAFCRLAVEAHGGKIWVDSPTEKGSRFNFTLPTAGP
jgi:PAS domain S-box-containing protein